MRIASWLESIFADMRFGARQCGKTPMITLAVVLSLAVGIGANTAVFTLLDAAILKPLPVADPERLAVIEWVNADGYPGFVNGISGASSTSPDGGMRSSSVSAPMHRMLARATTGYEAIVGISDPAQVSAVIGQAPATPVDLQYVSANFFQGLNVRLALGRPFFETDDRPGAVPAVIVSHRFWVSRLGGTPDAVGRELRVNDVNVRIAGVAPQGFFGLSVGEWTDLYAPLASRVQLDRSIATASEDPAIWWVHQVAVVAKDAPEAGGLVSLNASFRNELSTLIGAASDASVPEFVTIPGQRGITQPFSQIGTALWLLMLLVGLLLLIVCANIANLLLARSEGRLHETTVRLTLGATPPRIFRQQLIEALMLALAGGATGLFLGYLFSTAIHELFQVGRDASDQFALTLDARVVGYGAVLMVGATLLFGLTPAFRAARAYMRGGLGVQSRSIASATLRGPKMLVSVQVALCLGALVAAGLLGRSLHGLTTTDLGFDPRNLVYATVNPGLSDFPADRIEGYLDDVQRAIESVPGIASVSRLENRPLQGGGNFSPVNVPGNPREQQFDPSVIASTNRVGPEMFETLGIPLRAGRTVDATVNGVVVDELFAERFFGEPIALGRRFGTGAPENNSQYEVVGIAANVISLQLRNAPLPTIYVPHRSTPGNPAVSFAIRTASDPNPLLGTIRNVVAAVNPSVPLTELRTQAELLDRMLRSERLLAFLSGGFGVFATVLVTIGMSGLLAYSVARRTSEIGLRMALGAAPGRMVGMVMKDSFGLVFAGLLLGIPCAVGVAKLLESSLYELTPADPLALGGSVLILLVISLAAAYVPAHRAAMTAPGNALRGD